MKIAYIIPSLKNKGPIIVVKELVENLLVLGVRSDDILVYYFDESNEVQFPVKTKRIKFTESINISKYDIVHSHMLRPDIYLLKEKISNLVLLKKTSAKIVTTLHQRNYENLYFESKNVFRSMLISFIWEFGIMFFDKIVVLSESMKRYYEKRLFFGKRKLDIIGNGRTINRYSEEVNYARNNKNNFITIGTACNLNKRKNLEIVLLAISKVPNAIFHIIGDGDERVRLQAICNDLDIEKRVFFWGYKRDALAYFRYFDVFILSSKSEGMSLSLIEAAGMKKAIMCSDIEPNHDLFNSDEAIFFDYSNVDELVEKLKFANIHKDEYAAKAYEKYISKYTGLAMAQNYYRLYKDTIYDQYTEP